MFNSTASSLTFLQNAFLQFVVQWLCDDDHGTDFPEIELQHDLSFQSKKLFQYIHVKPLFNKSSWPDGKLWAPLLSSNFADIDNFMNIENALTDEVGWLKRVNEAARIYLSEAFELLPGWSQYHASFKRGSNHPPGINTVLPVLTDNVNSLKIQNHCVMMNQAYTKILNPTQIPVNVSDCPVYGLSKELQWCYPNTCGEYFLGTLHIEKSLLTIHG